MKTITGFIKTKITDSNLYCSKWKKSLSYIFGSPQRKYSVFFFRKYSLLIAAFQLRQTSVGKDEKFRMTNLEWGVDFFSMTNLVKTSSVGQI